MGEDAAEKVRGENVGSVDGVGSKVDVAKGEVFPCAWVVEGMILRPVVRHWMEREKGGKVGFNG